MYVFLITHPDQVQELYGPFSTLSDAMYEAEDFRMANIEDLVFFSLEEVI